MPRFTATGDNISKPKSEGRAGARSKHKTTPVRFRNHQVIAFLALLVVLLLAQGGFFPFSACACGAVASLVAGITWLRLPGDNRRLSVSSVAFLGFALAYLMSALINRPTLTTLTEAGSIFAAAAFALLGASFSEDDRARTVDAICWAGVATGLLGELVVARLVPAMGALELESGRLQLTFQYANAAGSWFGLCALLCLLSPNEKLRAATPVPALAMLLTQSGGSVVAFALSVMVVAVRMLRAGEWDRLSLALLQAVITVVCFGVLYIGVPVLSLFVLAGLCGFCYATFRYEGQIKERIGSEKLCQVLVATVAVGALLGVVLLRERLGGSAANLVERSYHVKDSVSLWATSPLVGIGPDNWQYYVRYVQTAQYPATVVHCSYAQILVDAGILGLGMLGLAVIAGVRGLVANPDGDGGRGTGELVAVVFLLAHALVDFDFRFCMLVSLLAFLLSGQSGRAVELRKPLAAVAAFAVCLPLNLAGMAFATMSASMSLASASGDYAACASMYEGDALAWHDGNAQADYMAALRGLGYVDTARAFWYSLDRPTDRTAIQVALACYEAGDAKTAGEALVTQLERQPLHTSLFESAKQIFKKWGIDPSVRERYVKAVERANSLVSDTDSRLPGRKKMPIYKNH